MLENLWLVIGLVAIVLCGSRAANGMLGIREDDNESNGGYLFHGACTGELCRIRLSIALAHLSLCSSATAGRLCPVVGSVPR